MPKWLVTLVLIVVLVIEVMHFASPGAIPNWLAILIMSAALAAMFIFTQLGRRKEMEQIRNELQQLRRELNEVRDKQH